MTRGDVTPPPSLPLVAPLLLPWVTSGRISKLEVSSQTLGLLSDTRTPRRKQGMAPKAERAHAEAARLAACATMSTRCCMHAARAMSAHGMSARQGTSRHRHAGGRQTRRRHKKVEERSGRCEKGPYRPSWWPRGSCPCLVGRLWACLCLCLRHCPRLS